MWKSGETGLNFPLLWLAKAGEDPRSSVPGLQSSNHSTVSGPAGTLLPGKEAGGMGRGACYPLVLREWWGNARLVFPRRRGLFRGWGGQGKPLPPAACPGTETFPLGGCACCCCWERQSHSASPAAEEGPRPGATWAWRRNSRRREHGLVDRELGHCLFPWRQDKAQPRSSLSPLGAAHTSRQAGCPTHGCPPTDIRALSPARGDA